MAVADRRNERATTQAPACTDEQSIIIEATPEALYDLVSDVTRTGEWSPVCTTCRGDDAGEAGQVGAWFTDHNELPGGTAQQRTLTHARGWPCRVNAPT